MSRTQSLLSLGTKYCAYSKKRSVWFNNSHRGIKLKEENAPISFIGQFVLHKICVSQLIKRILKGLKRKISEQYLAASLKWDQISVLVCFMANLASLIRMSYRLHVKKKNVAEFSYISIFFYFWIFQYFPQGANKSMSLFLANCEAKLKSSLLSFMQTVTWNNTSFVENSLDFVMEVWHVKWVMVHKQIECSELFFTEVLLPGIGPPPISDWSKTDFLKK